jgi:hypothetical protein
MKAIIYTHYGSPDVLRLAEVQKPAPQDDQVLLKVCAASAAAGDWHLLRAKPFPVRFMSGMVRPKHPILGARRRPAGSRRSVATSRSSGRATRFLGIYRDAALAPSPSMLLPRSMR